LSVSPETLIWTYSNEKMPSMWNRETFRGILP
jgi:hypothetical protein